MLICFRPNVNKTSRHWLRTGCIQKSKAKKPLGLDWSCLFNSKPLFLFPTTTTLPSFPGLPPPAGKEAQPARAHWNKRLGAFSTRGTAKNFCVYPAQLFTPSFCRVSAALSHLQRTWKNSLSFLQLWLCPGKSSGAASARAEAGKVEGAERQLHIQYTHSNLLL